MTEYHITFMIKTLPTVSIKLCGPLCGKKQGTWCKSSSAISITKITGKNDIHDLLRNISRRKLRELRVSLEDGKG